MNTLLPGQAKGAAKITHITHERYLTKHQRKETMKHYYGHIALNHKTVPTSPVSNR